ncbi:MAG: hypothetical protein RLZZ369_583 [Pseudomonadota bacterium]
MRFPQFNPRRLQARIVVVYLGMLLIVQAISYWFIQDSLNRNARTSIHTELVNGEKVFKRLLSQKNDNLEQATRVLASDFGFRAAVASGDQATIQSALVNHGERIQANVAIFTDAQFNIQASATPINTASMVSAVKAYAQQGNDESHSAHQIEVIDGQPFQIVAVPIRAPQIIGWVGMGFKVTDQLLKDLKDLSQLDVALMLQQPQGKWTVASATMPSATSSHLSTAWPPPEPYSAGQDVALWVNQEEFRAIPMALPSSHGSSTVVALLMESVAQATAPYAQLKLNLLILTGIGVFVFACGSFITAKRITTPLRVLSASARRLEHGDYGARVQVSSKDEIGELAQSFETMRQAIQAREGEIRRLAYQDSLTDLPNREQFRSDLRHNIMRARDEGVPCTILLMDLDRFKHVNDVLGHRFGDRLLRSVAERLRQEALDPEDVLARLSGDEFAILLPGTSPHAATLLAKRIIQAFERPFTLDDHTVDLSSGIGVACSPENGLDVDVLMSRAEMAMYAAKQSQSGYVTYHPGLDSTSEESLTLISETHPDQRVAHRHRQRRIARLPATQGQHQDQPGGGCRSLGTLAAPHTRHGPADEVHPVCRADRLHPPDHHLDVGTGRPKLCQVAGARLGHENLSRFAQQDRTHLESTQHRRAQHGDGDHRERDHGRSPTRLADPEQAARHGLEVVHRRLRNGLLVIGLPQAFACR